MENTKFCICNDPRSENYKIIRKPNNLIIIGNLSFQLLQYVSKSVFVSICVFLHLEFYIFEFVTPLGHKNRKFHRLTIITKIDRHMVTLFDHLDICVPVYSFHPFSRFYSRVIYRICNFDREDTISISYCTYEYIVQKISVELYSCRTVV